MEYTKKLSENSMSTLFSLNMSYLPQKLFVFFVKNIRLIVLRKQCIIIFLTKTYDKRLLDTNKNKNNTKIVHSTWHNFAKYGKMWFVYGPG